MTLSSNRHPALTYSWSMIFSENRCPLFRDHALAAAVDVVESDDVVVAGSAADLHLDQLERNFAGIGEPMNAADRDIDRLVFVHDAHVAAERDLGRSLHHHPMLRPMEVLLQREHAARLHDDAFDLVAGG